MLPANGLIRSPHPTYGSGPQRALSVVPGLRFSHSVLSLLPAFAFFILLSGRTACANPRESLNMDYSPFFAQAPQPYHFMGMPPTPTYSGEEKIVSRFTYSRPLSHQISPLTQMLKRRLGPSRHFNLQPTIRFPLPSHVNQQRRHRGSNSDHTHR